ncbi:MAG: phenylalanine--tRNA ligase subunit beta [Acidobacteria bacterium]|nr:phenylalanine--tRNA ligase subunit beta [Acidobacteriota bacterium]
MKVLFNWLKEFVAVAAPPQEVRSRLSMAGIAIESVEDSATGPVLDADLTTNRADCMSHYGIAREIAALYGLPLKSVAPKLTESSVPASSATHVEIECPDLCGRYTARVLRGVKVGPSPDWLKQRLESLGQASINNVVDATNYVMLELGQPLHAFDLDTLTEKRIVVRRARANEKLTTLDNVERKLSPDMCMIADAARSVAVGGVMGGGETEISFFTTNVLLESAWFEPVSLRRTSKALGLRTEASTRFERGADPEMAELASRRCAELILQLAGGELLAGVVDVYPAKPAPKKIELTRKELLRVMGSDVSDREIEAVLSALGFAPVRSDAMPGASGSLMAAWECARPSWRQDVTREIDLIEEIARHYGFDKFPARMHPARQAAARLPHADAEDRLRERLVALGYQEIVSIPLVDPGRDALFRADSITPAKLAYPLAEDASTLRTSGIVNMLQALEWNINRGQRNLRLFEIGRAYELRNGTPVETRILTLGASGLAREKSIHESACEFSFADLKGDLDSLGELLGGFVWDSGAPSWLHPARSARLSLSSVILSESAEGGRATDLSSCASGHAGQLTRRFAEKFKLRQDVFLAELPFDRLCEALEAACTRIHYEPIPRFPAVERDFSLVLADGVTFADVAEKIRALAIPEIASIEAGDLFRGGAIPDGKYSLLVRVVFQSHDATLTESRLSDFSARIISTLEKDLSASLRTA